MEGMPLPLPRTEIFAGTWNKSPVVFSHFHTILPGQRFPGRIYCRKMDCPPENTPLTQKPVSISYSELQDKGNDLSEKIEDGFGPNGLGIIAVSNVPGFSLPRENLLHLAPRLKSLPETLKEDLEDPESRYNFGWSHGKEKLESGKLDVLKGSFYANPIFDVPTTDVSLIQRYPSYCRPNKWPSKALPDLEGAFKTLGKLMLDVGLMLAYHCDSYGFFLNPRFQYQEGFEYNDSIRSGVTKVIERLAPNVTFAIEATREIAQFRGKIGRFGDLTAQTSIGIMNPVAKEMPKCADETLQQILLSSRCHKGRLLYYFPRQQSNCTQDVDVISSWCGWHTDHGSLTGLTSGMFMRDGLEIACPDSGGGLYIKTRMDQIVKVVFGADDIAYQIGETTEILSRGHLCATPHCVQAPKGEKSFGVERATFALFMQPDWDQKLSFPKEVHLHQEFIPPNGTLTFGEYSEMVLNKYYHRRL